MKKTKLQFAVVLPGFLFLALLWNGCSGTTNSADLTPPSVETALTFTGTGFAGTTVNWGAASDDVTVTASLSYKVVQASSSAAIDTVTEADAATATMAWTANTTSFTVSGLSLNTTYYFAVLVKDAAGNKSLYAPVSVTTSDSADTTPPVLSAVSEGTATSTTESLYATSNEAGILYYIVTVNAATPTSAQVSGGKDGTGASAAVTGSSAVSAATAKTISVSGLDRFTKYYYYLAASDASGNISSVSGGHFATIGDNCIARYRFEGGASDSVGSYNLSATGTPAYSTSEVKDGTKSLSLNGSTVLSSSFALSDTQSISAWIYMTATSVSYPTPVAVGGTSGMQICYQLSDSTLMGVMGNFGTSASVSFSAGSWHHVVVTGKKSTNTLSLYVDGVLYTGDGTGDYSSETTTITIGDDGTGSYFWKGYIDDVQIYNRVLSSSEVAALYGSY